MGLQAYGICIKETDITLEGNNFDLGIRKEMQVSMDLCGEPNKFMLDIEPHSSTILPKRPLLIEKKDCDSRFKIEYLRMNVYTTGSIFDLRNYKEPIQQTVHKLMDHQTSSGLRSNTEITIRRTDLVTDSGFFVKDEKRIKSLEIDELIEKYQTRDPGSIYWNIRIKNSGNYKEITRSYYRLNHALAAIGGLSRFFTMLGILLYFSYNQYHYTKLLILEAIIPNESQLPQKYQLRSKYLKMSFQENRTNFCTKKRRKNLPEGSKISEVQMETLESCREIVNDRLDMKNY